MWARLEEEANFKNDLYGSVVICKPMDVTDTIY